MHSCKDFLPFFIFFTWLFLLYNLLYRRFLSFMRHIYQCQPQYMKWYSPIQRVFFTSIRWSVLPTFSSSSFSVFSFNSFHLDYLFVCFHFVCFPHLEWIWEPDDRYGPNFILPYVDMNIQFLQYNLIKMLLYLHIAVSHPSQIWRV